MSTIGAVQTRGPDTWGPYWVTQFRLHISQDCVNFSPIVDQFGATVVYYYMFASLFTKCKKLVYTMKCFKYNISTLNCVTMILVSETNEHAFYPHWKLLYILEIYNYSQFSLFISLLNLL